MARIRQNGGFVGKINNTTTSGASGIFGPNELQYRRLGGLWPNVTATAAAQISDEYFEYTTLLLPGNGTNGAQNNTFLDGSTNNFTITRNGNTTQGTFGPFSQTGWGNYFDGSGDYLQLADSTAWDLSGDYTIEMWINVSAISSSPTFFQIGSSSLFWYISSATKYLTTAGSLSMTASTAITLNSWNHIAICRSGSSTNNTKMYLNGVKVAETTNTTSFTGDGSNGLRIGAEYPSNYYLNGYISNLRVVNGTAVYTADFTPPTAALTAITNTSLLTCQSNRFIDNSTNNFTITRNGDTSVVAFSPFNPTLPWSAATNGGSGYFDGNGDYLTAPSNAAFQLGSQDFTVELSIYINAFDSSGTWFVGPWGNTSGTNRGWVFAYVAGGTGVVFNYSTNGTNSVQTQSSTTLLTKTWYHFAAVRNGNTLTIYQNGQSIASSSMTGVTIYANTNDVYLGRNPEDIGQVFQTNGYISNMRIVKGVAVYTGNFTPPTAPITNAGSTSAASYPSTTNVNTSFASSATSLLLNFTNAGIYDATSKNDLETVDNARISTAISAKWGNGSMYFDGAGDYLTSNVAATNLYAFGTGDFTIEMWVYFVTIPSAGNYYVFYDSRALSSAGDTRRPTITQKGNTIVYFTNAADRITSGTVSANNWYHVAISRSGTSTRMFIDGVQAGSTYVDTTDYNNTSGRPFVGGDSALPAGLFNGYIQDLRVTKGYARYTANFTPPTAAFPTL